MPAAVSEEKLHQQKELNRLIDSYERMAFVKLDNVTSQQMHDIRRELIGKAEIVVGKKTTQKKIITLRADAKNATPTDKKMWEILCKDNFLTGNVALCFTNNAISDITAIFEKYKVQAPARVGAISPVEVVIAAGNTGMEPTMTSFFQALNIITKIDKGTVAILTDKKVLSPGDKVDSSIAALLQKLKISPFYYNPVVVAVWEKGMLFTPEDLLLTESALEAAFSAGIASLTGLSLGSGVATELSLPHAVADGYKNLLAAAVATNFTFTEFGAKALIENIKSGKAAAAAAPAAAAPAKAAPAAAKKKATPPPSDGDDDMFAGGLF